MQESHQLHRLNVAVVLVFARMALWSSLLQGEEIENVRKLAMGLQLGEEFEIEHEVAKQESMQGSMNYCWPFEYKYRSLAQSL